MIQQKLLKKNNAGFSLAEILISVIILLLVLTIVSSIFTLNQKVSRKSNAKAELTQNGRIVIDTMSREIRQAKSIVTPLPPDNSNPDLLAHELEFEDGHIVSQIQYLKYYVDDNILKKQTIAYYFDYDPSTYVHWNESDPFGSPDQIILEEKIIGEFFDNLDFYGEESIIIDLTLQKNNETVEMRTEIHPRNI